ncbi:hypothetical protein Lesp02_00540 [Lentzea sp. NBRC 105346]|uniref:LVIVD repeat-containing protein n=1 Tax=Lentzea sp. NBRC 105346 TaxID=3032205 RepID=UPI0024A5FDF2|nr:hypothetical protein [Lentzea sp. NBRC 105346]GLZ27864.1 hypothetical protein Lesp02_00540 [Lentzea sp. NBRC 105346]
MRTKRVVTALAAAALAAAMGTPGVVVAHPGQHGPLDGHLLGPGAWGDLTFLGKADLTNTDDLIADVAIDPRATYAYLANWGKATCDTNRENGDPDAGAYVVDITDMTNPKQVGFIPHSQDSRPGEGMQAVHIDTKFYDGTMLVMNNEHCGKNGRGGVSLYDVSDPRKPVKLSEHFGDRANLSLGDANDIHSAFAWDTGSKAYVVLTDNFEQGGPDVDILDITNPKRPRLIREIDVDAEFPGLTQTNLGLVQVFLHDMVVKRINGHWVMLLSYWDGGYVQLNVDDPTHPTLIGDTDYTNPDPEFLARTGIQRVPEGNGHQNEFTADNQFFIGTDEDFAPYGATNFAIASGPNAGPYPSVPVPGSTPIVVLNDDKLNGPVVYGGYGCPDSAAIPTPASVPGYLASLQPGEEKIVVLQRGPTGDPNAPEPACFPGDKAHQAVLAGWDGVVFVQRHGGTENPPFCGSGAFVDAVVGVCTNHEAYHKMFGTPVSFTYPDGPAIGTVGARIEATAAFDGWGYVHLFSNQADANKKFAELDTFAIPEAMDPAYAVGFGDLTVHEVATDPNNPNRAYLSYYAGGMRSLTIVGTALTETGGYLAPNGNDFWGVEAFTRNGKTYVAGSDRDDGLYLFATGP